MTLKSSEFRIGNCVNYPNYHNGVDKKWKVRSIFFEEEYIELTDGRIQTRVLFSLIERIHLNAAHFLKYGFANTDTGFLKLLPNGTQLSLIKIRGKYSVGLSGPFGLVQPTSIQYLHQLQNLYFALTGQELNVEL